MALDAFISQFGLLAIFAGAGIEGEAVVATGGVLAHKGLLPIWGVALAGAAGSFLVDQFWFFIGRRFRDSRLVRWAKGKPAYERTLALLERHPTRFIMSFRFIYGLRTISPIAIGTSQVPARKFVPLNLLAASIWAPLIAWLGYLFGKAIDPWLHDVKSIVIMLFGIAVALGLIGLLVHYLRGSTARS